MKNSRNKPRRFETGGDIDEAEYKRKGLEESNKDEPIGFFKRFKMGNIDEPGSEAYNQLGAGRGRRGSGFNSQNGSTNSDVVSSGNSNSKREAYDAGTAQNNGIIVRPTATPNPIYAAGEREGKKQSSGDAAVAESVGPRIKPVAKPPIVTKEQLAASGLSLRDYMNKQKGLKRQVSMEDARRNAGRRGYDEAGNSITDGMKKGGQVKKMAFGGSVSRGDGIAQRGKTKGRYI